LPLVIWTPEAYRSKLGNDQIFLGLFYGIMLVMLAYNLFIYFSLRDNSYLFYCFFLVMTILYQLNADGIGYQYIWSDNNWMSQKFVIVAWNLLIVSYILFSRSFLKTRQNTPGLDQVLLILIGLSFGNAILSQVGWMGLSFKIGFYLQAAGTLILLTICGFCIKNRYRPSYFYMVAMFALLTGGISTLLKNSGIIADSFMTAYGSHIGSALEIVFLSLGLADRINTANREKQLAQQVSIHAQEEALANKQMAIDFFEKAESRIQQILNNAIEGIFQVAHDKTLIFVNPSMARIFGYHTPEEMIQSVESIESLIENKPEFAYIYQELIEKESLVDFETELICKDQSRFWATLSLKRIDARLNQAIFAEGMILDITDRRQREKAEQERQVAEQANQAKTSFLANISHELRTPMHGILGFAKFGAEKSHTLSREKLSSYFDQIYSSGTRLMGLVSDLLDISKLESGKMEFQFGKARLSYLAGIVINDYSAMIQDNQLETVLVPPGFLDEVVVDHQKICQVIGNLLSNAIKFSQPEGRIQLNIEALDGQLLFSITDNGSGIPEDELELVFNKFEQGKTKNSEIKGTGLGLAISREIIEGHRGKIWAEKNPIGGSIFKFQIPYQAP
ncbi:PAS domain S-box protein, partial [bacterium]|nr:PAS domain S-box protein [bacterium]